MGIGMRELLVILVVALLVFGTKKLKTIGSDLGGAVRGFKKAMDEGEQEGVPEPGVKAIPAHSTPDASAAETPTKPTRDTAAAAIEPSGSPH